jgi:WD40 repeat protein
MSNDVFISHSSKDKVIADALCAALESRGVRCWVAPRDILPGQEWGEAIVDAIAASRIMVLIFSANANASPQVRREVERAVHGDVAIVPFRIEAVMPTKSMEYFISTPHWLDAMTSPLEQHLVTLSDTVQRLLNGTKGAESHSSTGGAPSPAAPVAAATVPPAARIPAAAAPRAAASPVRWVRAFGAVSAILLLAGGLIVPALLARRKSVPASDVAVGIAPVKPAASATATVAAGPAAEDRVDSEGHRVVDLLSMIDIERDALTGNWERRPDGLACDGEGAPCIAIRYEPPEEYDVRMEFTRNSGNEPVMLGLSHNGGKFDLVMGAAANTICGMQRKGTADSSNPAVAPCALESGRRYASVTRLRRSSIALEVDGKRMINYQTVGQDLEVSEAWFRQVSPLAIGSYQSSFIFHKVELVEVKGRGRAVVTGTDPCLVEEWRTGRHDVDFKFALHSNRALIDDQVVVWDAGRGKPGDLDFSSECSRLLALSPDGRMVAGCFHGTGLGVFEVGSMKKLAAGAEHAGVQWAAFSADGTQLALTTDKTIELWDLSPGGGRKRAELQKDEPNYLAFSLAGRHLLTYGVGMQKVTAWDCSNLSRVWTCPTNGTSGAEFSPDGTKALVHGSIEEAILLDVADGRQLAKFRPEESVSIIRPKISPDGRLVLFYGLQSVHGRLDLFDVDRGRNLERFDRAGGGMLPPVSAAAWSPDGTKVLAGCRDGTVRLVDVATGKQLKTLQARGGAVESVAFTPDGKYAATGSADYRVRLFRLTGPVTTTYPGTQP